MPIRFARKPQPASPSPALARLRRSAISVALASILSSPAGAATITVTGPSVPPTLVTVTINWQQPNETVVRKYVTIANIINVNP